MCVTKKDIQDMIDETKQEILDMASQYDNEMYHKMSELMHTAAPETKKKIGDLHGHIQQLDKKIDTLNSQFSNHDEREHAYWQKMDDMHEMFHEIREIAKANAKTIKEQKEIMEGITAVVKGSKIIRLFVQYVVVPLGTIVGAIYAIKEWITK